MPKNKPNTYKLSSEEQAIEDAYNPDAPTDFPGKAAMMKAAMNAATKCAKDERVNIRLPGQDLEALRAIAAREGMGYQTLMASIIHKFAAGRLVDKDTDDRIERLEKQLAELVAKREKRA